MTARTILLVDDDADLRETLVEQLGLYEEFSVLEEPNAGKGIAALQVPCTHAAFECCNPRFKKWPNTDPPSSGDAHANCPASAELSTNKLLTGRSPSTVGTGGI